MRALAFFVLSVALVGCNPHDPVETPTIPIPPPAEVAIELDAAAGTATLTVGPNIEYAELFLAVFDIEQGGGPVTRFDSTGLAVTDPFPANAGDQTILTYYHDGILDGSYCIVLRATPPALSDTTDLCP